MGAAAVELEQGEDEVCGGEGGGRAPRGLVRSERAL